jgi:hypothetical protein
MFGRRAVKVIQLWTITLNNKTPNAVGIGEGAILRNMSELKPYSHEMASILIQDAEKKSPWSIAARVVSDLVLISSVLGTGGIVAMPDQALAGMALFSSNAPYLSNRLLAAKPNILQNFEAISLKGVVTLEPGEGAVTAAFTAPWLNPSPRNYTIDVSQSKTIQLIR